VTEPQPPAWWQPPPQLPVQRPPERPARPFFRERRPIHWWTVVIGVVASVIWYVLIGAAAWSGTSLIVGMLVGMALAGVATWLLVWRGDPGLGIGLGMMIGFTASFMVLVAAFHLLFDSAGLG
jgi:hypothetical protein